LAEQCIGMTPRSGSTKLRNENTDLATGGAMAGFALMMLLDVALG